MATEEGVVTQVGSDGTAQVKTVRSGACKSCSARHSCKPGEAKEMEVAVLNPLGAKPGDRVILTFDTGNLLKATFLLYILPIIGLLVGAIIGNHLALQWQWASGSRSGFSALVGFAGLFTALLFVRKKGNQLGRRTQYRPRITRIMRRFPTQNLPIAEGPCPAPMTAQSRQTP